MAAGPDRLFDFCLDMGIPQYGLNFVAPANQPNAPRGTPVRPYIEPQRMAPYLRRLYDRWREHGDPYLRIREVNALRSRVLGESTFFCTVTGGCFGRFFGVEPDGAVSHCVDFGGDSDYILGNILTDDFDALSRKAPMQKLTAANEVALSRMRQCPNYSICNGWCPRERYTSVRHNLEHRDDCCGLRELIDHIRAAENSAHFANR